MLRVCPLPSVKEFLADWETKHKKSSSYDCQTLHIIERGEKLEKTEDLDISEYISLKYL